VQCVRSRPCVRSIPHQSATRSEAQRYATRHPPPGCRQAQPYAVEVYQMVTSRGALSMSSSRSDAINALDYCTEGVASIVPRRCCRRNHRVSNRRANNRFYPLRATTPLDCSRAYVFLLGVARLYRCGVFLPTLSAPTGPLSWWVPSSPGLASLPNTQNGEGSVASLAVHLAGMVFRLYAQPLLD
jgi:hypothetical protein